MKIVINNDYGGFGLSKEAQERLDRESLQKYNTLQEERSDPVLVHIVEELGEAANDGWSYLKIVELPDNVTDWRIEEYDGLESIIYVVDGKMHDL